MNRCTCRKEISLLQSQRCRLEADHPPPCDFTPPVIAPKLGDVILVDGQVFDANADMGGGWHAAFVVDVRGLDLGLGTFRAVVFRYGGSSQTHDLMLTDPRWKHRL